MNHRRTAIRLLALTTVGETLAIAALWLKPLPTIVPARSQPVSHASEHGAVNVNADSLAGRIVARNPFRWHRSSASVRYNPVQPSQLPSAAPLRPRLAVAGIVFDDQPVALVEGLPGAARPVLLKIGGRFGDYTVQAIVPTTVTITTRDTTYVLSVRGRQ